MSDEPQQGWTPRDATVPTPAAPARKTEKAGKPERAEKTEDGGKRPRRRTGWRRVIPTWRMTLGALLLCALLLIGGFLTGYLLVDIPPANASAVAQSNVYLYKDGTPIARDGEINRENVSLSQVPLGVQQAVLAAEDRDFYSKPAVDPQAMLRGAWNTATGKGKQSGSTITQQYVKNYYLGQEQTVTRKLKEFFIAVKLGREVSKSEILRGYLNTSYFGRNAYGIQAAAQAYYGKDVTDLDTAEGAYLASLLKAPSAYDVATHPGNRPAAEGRWNYVLDGMVKEKWLSPAARAVMAFPAPRRDSAADGLSGQRGYVVQAVEEYLSRKGIVDENTLATGGYRITTTLEPGKQDALTDAVDDQVTSRLDTAREADRNVRVGGVSIDPATGKVLAMYGGVDYTKQFVNNATRRDYQVGSAFKPFVFTAAVEHGSTTQEGRPITPNTVYDGTTARRVQGWTGAPYAPANEDDVSYGRVTVSRATDESVNAVYAQMAVDVGPARVRRTAVALGLPATTPDLTAAPSIALGTATASVLDMAQAYATLANHGRHGTYTLVEKVTKNGVEVDLPAQRMRRVVSREAADTTTAILRSVVDGGTGTAAGAAGRPAAGKTGTAEEDRAAWFAGYTPDLVTVVAVMGQNPDTGAQTPLYGALGQTRINGGGAPAEIWARYTAAALQGSPVRDFELKVVEDIEKNRPPFDPRDDGDATGPRDPGGRGRTGGWNEGGSWGRGGPASPGPSAGGPGAGGPVTGGPVTGAPATGTTGPGAGGTVTTSPTAGVPDGTPSTTLGTPGTPGPTAASPSGTPGTPGPTAGGPGGTPATGSPTDVHHSGAPQ
ncbi:penicillin-binding protein [Streptomyces sp. PKU-EA00015]|uniref:transglycosylase domain-containing protein n=1 Tax=Streptomyces sp. PKU-EA00015 TaxID=2748326 RepID=UPI00159FF399|nr:transglycosylase domain-containing protein [Streptomyces sp. PKU-EA00015]NWF30083.1 penicillin-binding protein [Streptomyces sp. PKU-EA00015]